jgi:DNA-binding response OmpR family regulator
MTTEGTSTRIILIDRQAYWLQISAPALLAAGFAASSYNPRTFLSSRLPLEDLTTDDLIVLGCSTIGFEGRKVIEAVLAIRQRLLLFYTVHSWQETRNLVLQGVDDVVDKPYNPATLVTLVQQALESRSKPHRNADFLLQER